MSLKRPTPLEYSILGAVNALVAVALGLRSSWTAAYFALLSLVAFGCAVRARSSG